MQSVPTPEESPDAADLRGRLFTDLDRLAFALEMEAAERLSEQDAPGSDRLQCQRLGVRLAQRLVTGIWADEVNLRVQEWAHVYDERTRQEVEEEAPTP